MPLWRRFLIHARPSKQRIPDPAAGREQGTWIPTEIPCNCPHGPKYPYSIGDPNDWPVRCLACQCPVRVCLCKEVLKRNPRGDWSCSLRGDGTCEKCDCLIPTLEDWMDLKDWLRNGHDKVGSLAGA